MNTKQISNRKAAFMLAMAEDPKDINHAVAPAELMAIIAHTNPIQFEDGIGTLFMDSGVDEETYQIVSTALMKSHPKMVVCWNTTSK